MTDRAPLGVAAEDVRRRDRTGRHVARIHWPTEWRGKCLDGPMGQERRWWTNLSFRWKSSWDCDHKVRPLERTEIDGCRTPPDVVRSPTPSFLTSRTVSRRLLLLLMSTKQYRGGTRVPRVLEVHHTASWSILSMVWPLAASPSQKPQQQTRKTTVGVEPMMSPSHWRVNKHGIFNYTIIINGYLRP